MLAQLDMDPAAVAVSEHTRCVCARREDVLVMIDHNIWCMCVCSGVLAWPQRGRGFVVVVRLEILRDVCAYQTYLSCVSHAECGVALVGGCRRC